MDGEGALVERFSLVELSLECETQTSGNIAKLKVQRKYYLVTTSVYQRVFQRLGGVGIRRLRPRGGHQNIPFRGYDYMISYMVGKLPPNSTQFTRGLFKYVPGRGYFCAVHSQNGDKFVTSPPPPQPLNDSKNRIRTAQMRDKGNILPPRQNHPLPLGCH